MATWQEMFDAIVAETRRPEVPLITATALRDATLRAHHVDFFHEDLNSYPLTYAVSNAAVKYDFVNIHQTLPRLRQFSLIHGESEATGAVVEVLHPVRHDDIIDDCGCIRKSVFTRIGQTLRMYPAMPTGFADVQYYANPNITETGYASWIADLYKDQLVKWAAGIVFARSGFMDIARVYSAEHVEPFKDLLTNSHTVVGVH